MSCPSLEDVRASLTGLVLDEVDFAVGDAFVSRVRDVRVAIDRVPASLEPWLCDWLDAEQRKGAVLWVAAKTNWAKERADGPHGPFNRRVRSALITRFTGWSVTFGGRLEQYEASARLPADVAGWLAGLRQFHEDPLRSD